MTASLERVEAGEGREGMAAHFTSQNDSVGNWALMGHYFGKEVNFSALDSVSFWIRGSVDNYISFAFHLFCLGLWHSWINLNSICRFKN